MVAGLMAPAAFAQNNPVEAAKTEAAVKGAWKNPAGGSCDAAFAKTTARGQSVRGEPALDIAMTNAGTTVNGKVILSGAREGQVVNPTDDKAMALVEPLEGDKLHIIPLTGPAAGWPEVTLDLCPGSR
jgi:hypothetical protein